MKKIFTLALILFATVFLASPASGQKQQELNDVEATTSSEAVNFDSFTEFWPLSAGKVMGEPLYFLKTLKESVREMLYFSDYRKVDYNITLSEKRLVEAEKLYLEKKDWENGAKSLAASQQKREKALNLLKQVKGAGRNTTDLENRFTDSLRKQRTLLQKIEMSVPDNAKGQVADNISAIDQLREKLLK